MKGFLSYNEETGAIDAYITADNGEQVKVASMQVDFECSHSKAKAKAITAGDIRGVVASKLETLAHNFRRGWVGSDLSK